MDKKYKEEKRVFEKHIQKHIKMKKKFVQFFQDRVLAKKKGPCGTPHGQKQKSF